MLNQFSRTELLFGKEAMDILQNSRVAVFGVGGVGGYAVEALVRSGVGAIDLIDDDKVCLTNLNRQIIATRKTVGKYKVDVMKERILEINPNVSVNTYKCFYLPENKDEFDFTQYSYVIDAVDTVTAKLQLVMEAQHAGVPVISSMGAGNKLDPAAFEVADIYDTSVCPLAKVMRRELKKRNVKRLKVVYSKEKPVRPLEDMAISCRAHCICPPGTKHKCTERRDIPGSNAFVPSVVGLIIAGEVIKDLTGEAAARARAQAEAETAQAKQAEKAAAQAEQVAAQPEQAAAQAKQAEKAAAQAEQETAQAKQAEKAAAQAEQETGRAEQAATQAEQAAGQAKNACRNQNGAQKCSEEK